MEDGPWIVDVPIKNAVSNSYVTLPESINGISWEMIVYSNSFTWGYGDSNAL